LQPNTDWEQTLRYIGELFSDASDAVELKEWLITPRTDLDRDTETKHNLATVTFLLTSDNAGPYATVCLDFGELARRVWASNKREVLSLLAELIRQQEKSSAWRLLLRLRMR